MTAVSSEAWAKLREWAILAGKGWLLLSGSVVLFSLKAAVRIESPIKCYCYPVVNPFVQYFSKDLKISTSFIQLMESDNVGVTVIGTHFLDLSQISNDGDKGEELE